MCLHNVSHNATHRNGIRGDQSKVRLRFWRILMRLCYCLSPAAARSGTFQGCADAAKTHPDKQERSDQGDAVSAPRSSGLLRGGPGRSGRRLPVVLTRSAKTLQLGAAAGPSAVRPEPNVYEIRLLSTRSHFSMSS